MVSVTAKTIVMKAPAEEVKPVVPVAMTKDEERSWMGPFQAARLDQKSDDQQDRRNSYTTLQDFIRSGAGSAVLRGQWGLTHKQSRITSGP